MNILAKKLNSKIQDTALMDLLSEYGKQIYVPNGIIVQASEAKTKATKFNATIGIATENGSPMFIDSMKAQFSTSLSPKQIFPYSPMGGNVELRNVWKEEMIKKNPNLKGKLFSSPLVVSGLTNGICTAATLFLDIGENVVIPNMYWENYNLIFNEYKNTKMNEFPLFDKTGFNYKGLEATIMNCTTEKVFVMLNFPNNPTGYTPTNTEIPLICSSLKRCCNNGKKLVVFVDDAYFGLFFTKDVARQSLFATLCDLDENLLVIKGDAATKEEMAWGFRIAFLTYAMKGLNEEQYSVLEQKTMACIRGTISSCSTPTQNALLEGMKASSYKDSKLKGIAKIQRRYDLLKKTLSLYSERTDLKPFPFNSGYFMSFCCSTNAEELRQLLLNKYNTGIIRISEHVIRVAFSSIDEENIPALINNIYSASKDLINN